MSGGFLARWSKRKLAASLAAAPPVPTTAAAPALDAQAPAAGAPVPGRETGGDAPLQAPTAAEATPPPVEELTLASDFSVFLKEEVSEALRRQALHKLFADPHFNRMDGLDIYIDDYNVADPIPAAMMEKLKHAREWLGDAIPGAEPASEGALTPAGSVAPAEADARDGRSAAGEPVERQPAAAGSAATPAASPPGGGAD